MARGSSSAQGAATSAQDISNTASGNAGALYGSLVPQLEAEAAHPAGIDPTTLARMDTAAEEAGGGSNASAVGQGGLRAARTRNAGGADAAIASGVRSGGETVSRGILGNRLKSAQMQEGERRSALSGLEGLYGANLGGSVNALGEVARNVNADTEAENASWDWAKYILDPAMQMAGQADGQALSAQIAKSGKGGGG